MKRHSVARYWKASVVAGICFILSGCVSGPPRNTENICDIFDQKNGWYNDAKKASKRWGIPISLNMAVIHQESRFVARAKPPRTKILWVIPGPRKSSAYGYPQAKDETWKWYKKKAPHRGADRSDFDDAIDFVAWYNSVSAKKLNLRTSDAYNLYLAYHEGMGGFKNQSYNSKPWLKKVAQKVSVRASQYKKQLSSCENRLARSWWPF